MMHLSTCVVKYGRAPVHRSGGPAFESATKHICYRCALLVNQPK